MTYNFDTKDTPVMMVEDLARALKAFYAITGDNGLDGLNAYLVGTNMRLHKYKTKYDYDNPANNNDDE